MRRLTLGTYLRRRLLQALATILLLTFVVHAAITVIPGDPVRALFGFRSPPPDVVADLRARFRLDDPYPIQYLAYLRDLLQGDLGTTISLRPRPINAMVARALPVSAVLVTVSLALQVSVGYFIAVVATLRRSGLASRVAGGVGLLTSATPVILTGYVLQVTLTEGFGGLGWFPFRWRGGWQSYALPTVALALMLLGPVVLLLRSEMHGVLESNFAKFALSTGLPRTRLVGVHVARASIGPVIAYIAGNLGYLLTGLVVVETIFEVPGIGALIIDGIQSRDRSVVIGGVVVVALVVISVNVVADVLAAAVDPRLRFDKGPRT